MSKAIATAEEKKEARRIKQKLRAREWRAKNPNWYKDVYYPKQPKRVRDPNRKKTKPDPETAAWYRYNSSAKKRGIAMDLTREQFKELYNGSCFYCGKTPAKGVDRFENDVRIYEPENCEPCCRWCNSAKMDASYEYFVFQCHQVAKNHPL